MCLYVYTIHANAFQRGTYTQTAITCAALVHTATFLSVTFLSHHAFPSQHLNTSLVLKLCVGESITPGFMDLQACHYGVGELGLHAWSSIPFIWRVGV